RLSKIGFARVVIDHRANALVRRRFPVAAIDLELPDEQAFLVDPDQVFSVSLTVVRKKGREGLTLLARLHLEWRLRGKGVPELVDGEQRDGDVGLRHTLLVLDLDCDLTCLRRNRGNDRDEGAGQEEGTGGKRDPRTGVFGRAVD